MKRFASLITVTVVLTTIFALLFVSACSKKPQESKDIKIGAILPLTGDGAKYGGAAKKGIELALGELNNKGGIKGIKIKIIYEDSQGVPKDGVSALQKLITTSKVPAIIGDLFSSVTLAIAPIAEENKIVVLSPTSSAPKITYAGDYIFRNCASDIFEGSVMGEYAFDKLGFKKVGILYINNDYGLGIKEVFENIFRSKGGVITAEDTFEQSSTDFRTQLSKIKSSEPEAIYMIGYKEQSLILKQAKEIGINSQFLSTVMFEDPEIIKIAGSAAEGVIYSARAYDSESKEGVTYDFVKKYRQTYNEIPDIFAALSYDAMSILALAMERGGLKSDEIKTTLYSIKHYPGVVGETSFNENGDVVQPVSIKTVRNGKFIIYQGDK
jgi:branched-chain amino acid transport system substrate-binding protein